MKVIFTTFLTVFLGFFCLGQISFPTRDSVHIFWQPNLKITYHDYKGIASKKLLEEMQEYGYSACASIGIWSALDVPKKNKDRYTKFEKVYFAPAFERTTSCAITTDSLQIRIQNTYLDISEVCARWARKELNSIQDTIRATGVLTIMYSTINQKMKEKEKEMNGSYAVDVLINKREGSFTEWRTLIDKLLEETKDWATKPEECYRLMTGKPIEKGYIKAPALVGPLFNDTKNKNSR